MIAAPPSSPAGRRRPPTFVVSCEHGGNRIPVMFRYLFAGADALLDSHRGYDQGALTMARTLAAALAAPMLCSTVSRLLIDLNRSLHNRHVFSSLSQQAPAGQQEEMIHRHYLPYRTRLETWVRQACAGGAQVIHLSSHSFTPVLNGQPRHADIGLLYDPKRPGESRLCRAWQAQLALRAPELRVRRNYPYAGANDGMTRHLRQRFADPLYIGIELEVNQALVQTRGPRWRAVRGVLAATLQAACSEVFAPDPTLRFHLQENQDAASRRLRHPVQPSAHHSDDLQPEHSFVAGLGRDRP